MYTRDEIVEILPIWPIELISNRLIMAQLNEDVRGRLLKKAIDAEIHTVYIVLPSLDNNLNAFISRLAQADIQAVVISNGFNNGKPGTSLELAEDMAVNSLCNILPNNSFLGSKEVCIFELVEKALKSVDNETENVLVVSNFTEVSVAASLKCLGVDYPINEGDRMIMQGKTFNQKLSQPAKSLELFLRKVNSRGCKNLIGNFQELLEKAS